MELGLILGAISFLCLTLTPTMVSAVSLALPGCQEKCGNLTIPYPFGITSECSANSSFTIICTEGNSTNPPTPFLSSMNVEVLNISLYGIITVNQPVSPVKCSDVQTTGYLPISYEGSPFSISARYNSLIVLGCKNSVWLNVNKTMVGGCIVICNSNSTDTSCNGVNCCQATIPTPFKEFKYTYRTTEIFSNNSFCGYVFPVHKKWFTKDYKSYEGLFPDMSNPFNPKFGFAQLVLEWEFDDPEGSIASNGICMRFDEYFCPLHDDSMSRDVNLTEACLLGKRQDFCNLYPTTYYICENRQTIIYDDEFLPRSYDVPDYVSSAKYCICPRGYEGNPYIQKCSDIDECSDERSNQCRHLSWSCTNTNTDQCYLPFQSFCNLHERNNLHARTQPSSSIFPPFIFKYRTRVKIKIALISIGSGVGAIYLLLVGWRLKKAMRKRIKANERRKFFKRNGGLLLEQQLSVINNGLEKARLYNFKELTLATDHFNENRILGSGGQGTVYKGMLIDGRIVAVKKSQRVEEGDIEAFINEVVILSQVNHRNVVKLLGCCLETEVPLLVYEFVPNGTLLRQIHEPSEEFPLTWVMRLRIAREVAGALAYLHSSASAPIYHRDIKSTNILLDDKYRAKISDFGTSRSIGIDQTHLTTRVRGTFGYFDPEYFQSSQFTDKSDVYSFGVVMVELLTGEKAISSLRLELGRNLATHFVHSMEEDQLFDILDARVLREGKREEIAVVAELARRCLYFSGKRRPTMKEVAAELEAILEVEECSNVVQNCDGSSRECHPIDIAESHDSSSTSETESVDFDSITPFSPEAGQPVLGQP